MLRPQDVQCIGDTVAIRWQDGSEDFYPMEFLRAHSPSAEQQGERDLLGNEYGGSQASRFPGVEVTSWQAIGGYALQFNFSDGHRTGLYNFDYLKSLAAKLGESS